MTAGNLQILIFTPAKDTADHLMGYGTSEQHQQVGRTDLVLHRAGHLGEDLGPAAVLLAEVFILTHHTVVAAYDYYAHFMSAFLETLISYG